LASFTCPLVRLIGLKAVQLAQRRHVVAGAQPLGGWFAL